MKLTYRGVTYDYNPVTVKTETAEVAGKYRGLDWRFRNLENPPTLQPSANLTYRGVKYNHPGSQIPSKSKTPAHLSTQDRARSLMLGHTRAIKKRQQTMLSRLAMEIGVPDLAGEQWSKIQGKIHPSFRSTYDRFGSAVS